MKWLILQSDGEHKGQGTWAPNWFMRECYSIRRALKAYGHQADIWGLRHRNFESVPDFEAYDGLFVAENYETVWLPNLVKIKKPLKIQWIIDLHCQPPEHYDPISAGCDVVLHSTRQLGEDYAQRHKHAQHIWFPNGVDDFYFDRAHYLPTQKTEPLIFIGGLGGREAIIELMRATSGLVAHYGVTGYDYVRSVLAAKVQFNKAIGDDLNYRVFETIGLGTCLLTDYKPDLIHLGFRDGVNCALYTTPEEAVFKAKWLLTNGNYMEVAEAGYQHSKTQTYTIRLKNFLDYYLAGLPHRAPKT